ncbi:MAG: class I adenylate-forming enzyme family protein [Candidatus Omnitrophica bacterium]|nr:class I adenylate-forming enzyme family protein [Candidatus Omnitrophota bacterium]
MHIPRLLEANAKKYPNKPAIIFKGQVVTFSQLRDISLKLAESLVSLGLKKSDKVAIYLPNYPEYIYAYLAIWSLGFVAVPLDFMLTQEELASCLFHSQAVALITKPKPTVSFTALKEKCNKLKDIILCQEKTETFLNFEELLKKETKKITTEDIPDKDCSCIFYTSGTTGKPKGVLCNYAQLEAPAKAMAYFVDLNDKDIALCGALPFSHLGGLVFIQAILFLGATVVVMDRFIPLEFLRNVQSYKVSCLWLVPSMFYAVLQLKEFESFDLSSLKWIDCFGAPSSADQLRRFHKYCPQAELYNGWGMTETQGPSIVLPRGSNKIESVGVPAPWIEMKIFSDDDKELPQGQIGEIGVRSWVVTEGYYKDHEATAVAMRNGWFHTGDLGRVDSEGYLYIVGRKKEMIKVSGEIIFEPEVEAVIHKHPDVAEVAVIGVPDALRGELPKAYVSLKKDSRLSENDLRYFCRQHLAHFKIPHYFEFVASLPKTGAGKIDKEKLRERTGIDDQ